MDTKKYFYVIYYLAIGAIATSIIWTQDLSGAAFSVLFIILFLLCIAPIYRKLQNTGTFRNNS